MKGKIGIDMILVIIAIVIVGIFLILALAGRRESELPSDLKTTGLSEMINRANNADLQVFNAKITGFAGSQKGTVVRALITAVNSSNSSNEKQIKLVGGENIDDNTTYSVSMEYDSEGYVNTVTIK